MSQLVIRNATSADLTAMVDNARQLGWNPGTDDAALYSAVNSDSFFVGMLDGAIVTMVSAAAYKASDSSDCAYIHIGLYMTLPQHRGRGFGSSICRHALTRVESLRPRCIGCDAVPERVTDYAKFGFVTAYSLCRYAFTVGAVQGGADGAAAGAAAGCRIVSLASVPRTTLVALDAGWFGGERGALLDALIACPGAVCLAALPPDGDTPLGYICVRPAVAGSYRVGPLFSSNAGAAHVLLDAAARGLPDGARVDLDVPSDLPDQAAFIAAERVTRGLVGPTFRCERMYGSAGKWGGRTDVVYANSLLEIG